MTDVEQQVEKTTTTWGVLQKHGVTTETTLIVDLFWYADDAASANALAGKLRSGIAHFTEVKQVQGQWSITAKTLPGAFGLDGLQQLVRDMNALGAAHNCEFDGWGAALPDSGSNRPWWKFW
jgi:hypothetical protein